MNLPYTTEAYEPVRAHEDDAGLDLRASTDALLLPGEITFVGTGVRVAIPHGYVGLLASRSGLACKHGVAVVNSPGIIDSGYRGEIKVALINHGKAAYGLQAGDRVAQLLISPIMLVEPTLVQDLPDGIRGEAGFGSTGTK